jgi:carboxypeptidase C (cathepsin A)
LKENSWFEDSNLLYFDYPGETGFSFLKSTSTSKLDIAEEIDEEIFMHIQALSQIYPLYF